MLFIFSNQEREHLPLGLILITHCPDATLAVSSHCRERLNGIYGLSHCVTRVDGERYTVQGSEQRVENV